LGTLSRWSADIVSGSAFLSLAVETSNVKLAAQILDVGVSNGEHTGEAKTLIGNELSPTTIENIDKVTAE
jgi:hypothetical protein